MGMAKLPFSLSLLEQEVLNCAEDANLLLNRLIELQKTLKFPQSSKLFKQRKRVVLLFLESSAERTIYQRILEELDCIVETTNTIDATLSVLNRGFDLVLFDLDEIGFAIAARLKASQEKSLPHLAALVELTSASLKVMGLKYLIEKPKDAYLIKRPLIEILSDIAHLGAVHDGA